METTIVDREEVVEFLDRKTSKYPAVFDVISGKVPGVVYKETDRKSAVKLRSRLVYYQKHYPQIQTALRGNDVLVYRKDTI